VILDLAKIDRGEKFLEADNLRTLRRRLPNAAFSRREVLRAVRRAAVLDQSDVNLL
jgi:hypothetical protein